MRFKAVFRRDGIQGIYRLFRLVWVRGRPGFPAPGKAHSLGYSAKLSFALSKKPFGWSRTGNNWKLHVLFVRVHYCRSYAGVMV